MDLLWVMLAYLVGSFSFGHIAGNVRGINLAERDLPGASGTWRQLGPVWGILVAMADIAKGSLVAYLSGFLQTPWALPLMGVAVVAGHNWPLYFGFRGGRHSPHARVFRRFIPKHHLAGDGACTGGGRAVLAALLEAPPQKLVPHPSRGSGGVCVCALGSLAHRGGLLGSFGGKLGGSAAGPSLAAPQEAHISNGSTKKELPSKTRWPGPEPGSSCQPHI